MHFVLQFEVTICGRAHQPKVHGEEKFAKISSGAILEILGAAWSAAVRTFLPFAAEARSALRLRRLSEGTAYFVENLVLDRRAYC
ncbi:hypothetical protein [Roseovarius tibetensis]|uniref:hypothetical protein n=1 Tax=Roseovarius tibetensis TaxID=2685897 RepID=UPI003D7F49BE